MALFKDLKEIKDELQYLENINPTNWFSRWFINNRIRKLNSKIQKIMNAIHRMKNMK
jgi:hypothetical protein